MVRLIEVYKNSTSTYTLREVFINPKHVVSLREDDRVKGKLNEGAFPADFSGDHRFTRVVLDKGNAGTELIVVGTPSTIQEKIRGYSNELLLG